IELLTRRENEAASVVIDDLDPRVLYHVEILLGEEPGDHSRDEWLDLADDDTFNIGIRDEAASRDPGAEADDEHRPRLRPQQRRQVTEHVLQAHVDRMAAGLGFAADVKIAGS